MSTLINLRNLMTLWKTFAKQLMKKMLYIPTDNNKSLYFHMNFIILYKFLLRVSNNRVEPMRSRETVSHVRS